MANYDSLFEKATLPNGSTLNNRFALAPMVVFDGDDEGYVTKESDAFMQRRNDVGGLLIGGANAVSKIGIGEQGQLALYDDPFIESQKEYVKGMKAKGNKAIVQLQNAGREAHYGQRKYGKAFGPSTVDFPFLDYPVTEMTEGDILQVIDDFGQATRRAIEIGYDGVEVHGANHYLLQQFFSSYSNIREDKWGKTLENRMRFPLAVLKEVKETVKKYGSSDFIIGYRISPEEIHGQNIGYTIDDALKLVEEVVACGVDYFHVSTFGDESYKSLASAGNQTKPMNGLVAKS